MASAFENQYKLLSRSGNRIQELMIEAEKQNTVDSFFIFFINKYVFTKFENHVSLANFYHLITSFI